MVHWKTHFGWKAVQSGVAYRLRCPLSLLSLPYYLGTRIYLVLQVLLIESPDALISSEERAAAIATAEIHPNPLSWLPPELPEHVKACERTMKSGVREVFTSTLL